jgi:YVTN family beta-propeller protein
MVMRTYFIKTLLLLCWLPGIAWAEVAVVLNSNDDDMSLIDTSTYQVVKRVPLGKEPHHLMPTPDDRYLVVANAAANELVLLEPSSGAIVKRIPRIADPYHLGFSPDGHWFVINANRLNRTDIYRYENGEFALAGKVAAGEVTSHMAFSADSRTVFVTAQESNLIVAIDLATQKIRWQVNAGKMPAGIWLTPNRQNLLVGMTGEDYVAVVSAVDGKILGRLHTGRGAHSFLPKGDGQHAFLSNRVDNTISVIDMSALKVVDTISIPGGPDDMELKKDGSELWVTSRWINRVSVIDLATKKLIHSIRVGRSPHGIYFHTHAPRL